MIYDVSYKALIGPKPRALDSIKFGRWVRIYEGTRYLILFGSKKYAIYNRIRYLMTLKSSITWVLSLENQSCFLSSLTYIASYRKYIDFA